MFLDTKPYPLNLWAAKERKYSNWLKIADVIYATQNTHHILNVLQLELTERRRLYVINRLYSRFSALRAKEEKSRPKEFYQNVEPWKKDSPRVRMAFRHWQFLRRYIEEEEMTLYDLKSLMYKEYLGERRAYILKRLYGKFSTQRMRQERKEMLTWKLKRVSSDTCETK